MNTGNIIIVYGQHLGDILRLDSRELHTFIEDKAAQIGWKSDFWIGLNDRLDEKT